MPALMNRRREIFAQATADGATGVQACEKAGYSPHSYTATKVRAAPGVRERIREMVGEREQVEKKLREKTAETVFEKTAITKTTVMERLNAVVERCMTAEPVRGPDGEPTGQYRFDSSGAVRALHLLGKEIGMFIDRRESGSPGSFKDMTDDQVHKLYFDSLVAAGVKPDVARKIAGLGESGARKQASPPAEKVRGQPS